ncbi:MAG: hypothetical protein J5589_12410 [Firmicutes bacterium]|nr:hypothetical protein [Bacillota bacterium]
MSQYYNSYPGAYNQNYQQGPTPGLKALKNSFGSPIYLIATIAFTLTLVLSLVEAFVPSASMLGSIVSLIQQYAYQFGVPIPDEFGDITALMSGSSIAGTIVGMIPSILIALGMWLIYSSAKKASIPASTAGYSILQVMNIISMVLMCIATLMLVIFGIIGLVALNSLSGYYGGSSSGTMAVAAICLLIGIVIMIFVIIYFAKLAAIYSISKDVLRYNRSAKKISMFVIVINFIALFFSAIGTVSTLVSASAMIVLPTTYVLMTILSAVASFVASLLQTLTFVRARQEFSALTENKGAAGYQSYNFETGAYNTGSFNTGAIPQTGYQQPYQAPRPAQPQYQQPQTPYQQQAPYQAQPQYQQRPIQPQAPSQPIPQYQTPQVAPFQVNQPVQPSMQVPPAPNAPQAVSQNTAPLTAAVDHAQEIADQAASSFNDQQ